MPDYRKPPVPQGGRTDSAPPSPDVVDYSLEGTTTRLKSIRLRRRELELTEQHRRESERKANESKRAVVDKVQPSGRVRHDERGMAVWDLAIATGEFSTLSATSALKKLDVGQLSIEETTRVGVLTPDKVSRDKGGGFDPYNQRDTGRKLAAPPPAKPAPARPKESGGSVLDQLLGQKKK
jgi:hypothetical protein